MLSPQPTASWREALKGPAITSVEGLAYPRLGRGKVREIFDLGECLLLIATDRISAYDVVLPTGIPGKGAILTAMSLHWFRQLAAAQPHHLVEDHANAVRLALPQRPELQARAMVVRKLGPLPVEAVVRGYLAGSGWSAYQKSGKIHGQTLPAGLDESAKLPEPLFTPTTKAAAGHDEPLTLEACRKLLGDETYTAVRDRALALFAEGSTLAARAGLLLADTKFEFGTDADGRLYLIDEVLTPDSSRFWPADAWTPGQTPHAFDKQYVRDYLKTLDWDQTPPGPELPADVVAQTQQRYAEALERLEAIA